VTFLFSDIEGSTRLLGTHPREYAQALLRHDDLMRAAIAASEGVVFETIGDAVYAAFPSPGQGVRAALQSQLALGREDWGPLGAIRVRMAVHGGDVELRGAHYFGPALYLCARIMATGHGGQVLLSSSWAEAVRKDLQPGVDLRPLGKHRLKDIAEPQAIFQLTHPDLTAEFPPLRSLDPHATNLPALPNRTLGREHETDEVHRLLRSTRLLTLVGAGGVGKTRLALHACSGMLGEFDAGVWFVALASIRRADDVPSTLASTLGVVERPGETLLRSVRRHIGAKEMLLILDNFEQVLDAAALVADLLSSCSGLKVVVTSRTPLHLAAERQFAVPPLSARRVTASPSESDAVALFIERALAVRADLVLDTTGLAAIREICVRLDGLPLAIELAAARTRVLSPAAMKARLDNVLPVLRISGGDLPERHRSMMAAIGWSHALLETGDHATFARLGIFVGGFTLEAAHGVLSPATALETLDALTRLVDASLVEREIQPDGEPRFFMFEAIREYALERLAESGEADRARGDHAAWFREYAVAAETRIRTGASGSMAMWLRRVEDEQPNLRSALEFFITRGAALPALQMCWGLGWFWITRSHLSEGRRWAEAALAIGAGAPSPERGRGSLIAGQIALQQGDIAGAREWHDVALSVARADGDLGMVGNILCDLANVALLEGDGERAVALCEESLALRRRSGHPGAIGHALINLAEVLRFRDELGRASEVLTECLASDLDADLLLTARFDKAMLELERGDMDQAFVLLVGSLNDWMALRADVYVSSCLVGLAGVARLKGDAGRAAKLLGAAHSVLAPGGGRLWPADERTRSRIHARTRGDLGEAKFEDAFAAGGALPLEEAAALAGRAAPN
jgi:predicted ATPase/class 3 adenylate cyclase